MTRLVNQLMSSGIVKKQLDMHDRKIVNIILSDYGRSVLRGYKGMVKNIIRERLSRLRQAELTEMAAALGKLKNIGAKLE